MKNYIIQMSSNEAILKLEEEYKIVKILTFNTAIIYCGIEDIKKIKKINDFVSIFPDNPVSALDGFKI